MDLLPILKSFILLSSQLNAFSDSLGLALLPRSVQDVAAKLLALAETETESGTGAGESNPAIASLLPNRMSWGLKAGGDKGEVNCGSMGLMASMFGRFEMARR